MTNTSSELEFFQKRGFGGSVGFGERPALLVVDVMRGFTDENMPLGSDLSSQIEHINTLLDTADAANMPTFFSIVCYDDADCRDAGVWGRKMSGLFDLTSGSSAVELDPRLRKRPDASVFNKKYASSFFGTDFASRLQAQRVDTLIVTGCTTSGCVRATVVDAIQYGFLPIVPKEAVGDRSAAAHAQALFDIQAKYGDVLSVDETVKKINDRQGGNRG
ncbi:isochorismatase family protein [Pusillimonas sp.]|uniref:isochorismatase family protein n=1 Tax=Pusillimonas sp. TaxID=3040095 RepID=UPI0029A25900|nr:isochorismatase family protein [Pusillimonas sp.]MDX3893854.1 isochorismatase family protein [Pusillimonas sp.]